MKKNKAIPDANHYVVRINWDESSEGWLATVPAIPGCLCVMPTQESALKEIRVLIRACLEIKCENGHPVPQPDASELEEVAGVLPLLNISELARVAGVPRATLAARVRRARPTLKPNVAIAKRLANRLVNA
ncbi:MAG: type II toxin-antitoxin system HicB family antitoxin [Puniceicoccales bacterium]|jgi:predicted RNase H-like HicB family nuclease|nr:type II toxin-antitoxin system HicB family antitoxin [Puniceicoccales bacterium]